MKKFKFKLETVLSERKRVEDLRLREWTLAKRLLQGLVDDLTRLENELADAINKATELAASAQVYNIGEHAAVDGFIAGQKVRIIWKTQEIERGTKIVERKRLEYVQASQKRQALEKLKERKQTAHGEAAHKKELKQMDDIYIMTGAAQRRMAEEDEEANA